MYWQGLQVTSLTLEEGRGEGRGGGGAGKQSDGMTSWDVRSSSAVK